MQTSFIDFQCGKLLSKLRNPQPPSRYLLLKDRSKDSLGDYKINPPPRTRTCACSYLFACSYFLRVLISETLVCNEVKIRNSWYASRGWPMQKLGPCHMREASGKSLKIPGMPVEANRC